MSTLTYYSLVVVALVAAVSHNTNAWWLFDKPSTPTIHEAVANFDMDGVRGFFRFKQTTPNDPTLVEYDLQGLADNNKLFHVHVRPVPAFQPEAVRNNASAIAALCADPATGGHLNPHHITAKLPPKSAPLDKYETGDLSGKHGALVPKAGYPGHYVGQFTDDKLSLNGPNGIVGRSIVIHKNDGKRWVCANIIEAK